MSDQTNTNGVPQAPQSPKSLTPQQVGMMLMSLQRIQTLVGSQIRTAEMDAEQKQLTQSLGNRLLQHSGEFLNAWLTVYNEYAPLVRGVSSLLARVSNSQPAEG